MKTDMTPIPAKVHEVKEMPKLPRPKLFAALFRYGGSWMLSCAYTKKETAEESVAATKRSEGGFVSDFSIIEIPGESEVGR